MYRPVHAWVKVPLPKEITTTTTTSSHSHQHHGPAKTTTLNMNSNFYYHNTLCLEYPPNLLSGALNPTKPHCDISSDTAITGPKSLIVLIPGNPGMCQFYDKFVQELCRTIPSLAVVVPSLAGFSLPTKEHHHADRHRGSSPQRNSLNLESKRAVKFNHKDDDKGVDDDENDFNDKNEKNNNENEHDHDDSNRVFLLKDQLEFLYSFVDSFIIPIVEQYDIPFERTWIAGHSIGGWFSLHVLDHFREKALQRQRIIAAAASPRTRNSNSKDHSFPSPFSPQTMGGKKRNAEAEGVFYRAVLLAPTIAYMEESNNAKAMYRVIHHGQHFLPSLVSGVLTKLLPKKILDTLVDMAMAKELDAADVDTAQQLIHHPRVTRQILKMASDELIRVNPLDVPLLTRIQEHLIFYFVQSDDWVPAKVHAEIQEKVPNTAGFFVGEDPDVKHAWCSRAYAQVAHFVAHAFGSETGVQVSMSSAEAARAGFVLPASRMASQVSSPILQQNNNLLMMSQSRRRNRQE